MLKNRKVKDGRSWGKLMLLGGLLLFLFLGFGLTRELINRREANAKITDYQKKIQKIKEENSKLAEKISGWENSGDLEASARAKLGLEKPGEQTVIILRATDETTAVKTNQEVVNFKSTEMSDSGESNLAKWQRYFFGPQVGVIKNGSNSETEIN